MQFYEPRHVEHYIKQVYPQIYQQIKCYGSDEPTPAPGGPLHYGADSGAYTGGAMAGTVLLQEDDAGTTLLADEDIGGTTLLNEDVPDLPYLIRQETGERIYIRPGTFRLGKDPGAVDYAITTNSAISRLHAEIIAEGDAYYIRDNHSTNQTYVNGAPIGPSQDTRIFSGDSIMLADECFEFHVGS